MILNNHYSNDPRVTAEAESLIKHGYEVKVIAWDRKGEYPLHEVINSVEVLRVQIPKIIGKLLHFEILKVPVWQVLAYKKALELYKHWKFKIVHVHDWPDLPVGVMLKQRIRNIFLVYDSHEVWNYMIFTNRLPEWVWEVIWRERAMLKHIDALVTVGRGYKNYFLRYFGKVKIIQNAKSKVPSWKKPNTNPLTVVYIGGFDEDRCIKELVDTICEINLPVLLLVAGPKHKKYLRLFESSAECGVKYVGYVSKSDVIPMTVNSSVVYFVFKDSNPLYKIGMPNKLFEAISAGRASLAGRETASGNFVEEYRIGLVVDCNVGEIKRALTVLIENPKLIVKFGRRAYLISNKYNWSREFKKLVELYKEWGVTSHEKCRYDDRKDN